MPLYEYRCRACRRQVEVIQKFSDSPLRTCEACGGALEKLISSSGFILKGSGWYVTDYARGGDSRPAGEEGASEGDVKAPEDAARAAKEPAAAAGAGETSPAKQRPERASKKGKKPAAKSGSR